MEPERSAAGRQLVSLRRREPRACAECGTVSERYPAALYCSGSCRARAHRRQLGAEYNARQRERRAAAKASVPDAS